MDPKQFAKDKRLLSYIQASKTLIVDPNGSSRNIVRKLLTALEGKAADIKVADSFDEGKQLMSEFKPNLVFTDQALSGGAGLDLLPILQELHPKQASRTFVLIAENVSPALAALAAEEDVDLFILKPLTYVGIEKELLGVFETKITKQNFYQKLDEGKAYLKAADYPKALEAFRACVPLDSAPAAAHYYEGITQKALKEFDKAADCFKAGLAVNKTHYKCLSGLYDLQMELKLYDAAYQAIKTLTQSHPLSPKRIPDLIRLFIITKNYKDLEDTFDLLSSVSGQDDMIMTYVAAGLVICGKQSIRSGDKDRAVKMLVKSAQVANKKPKILQEIIQTFYDARLFDEAAEVMKKIPEDIRATPEFQVLWLEEINLREPATSVIKAGQELLTKNIQTLRVFELLISKSVETGRNKNAIEDLIYKACTAFPDKKDFFENLYKK